ncbi:MAG: ROK family protein [Dehalococcoidia bacterium]|nr:ROK family protein [Dehalococcoidia bacterium]
MAERLGLGIDIGGTGIKAAVVDLDRGTLVGERVRAATPQPAGSDTLTEAVVELTRPLFVGDITTVGIGFPAVVRRGVALSAVNVGDDWMYADLGRVFGEAFGRSVWALNDSDAAGLAEARFGAGRHHDGTILVATLGTGVGTSLVVDGHLVPNIELGCLTVRDKPAGQRVANSVRKRKGLSWSAWAADLNEFIDRVDEAVAPDLVIIGGGVSSEAHRYLPLIKSRPLVLPARLRNDAGIVGAAVYAAEQERLRAGNATAKVSQLTLAQDPAPEAEEPGTGAA